MKTIRRWLALALAVSMGLGLLTLPAAADADPRGGELELLSYNVHGLPIFWEDYNPWEDSQLISAFFRDSGYDFIGVQEDFNCHAEIAGAIEGAYPYQTVHQGVVPVGDGLGVFSKTQIYNQRNVPWEQTFGVFSDGSDELTPKGFVHVLARLEAPGAYVHIYVLHADAVYGDAGSLAARADNYRQLAADIAQYPGEPLLVMGDFNGYYGEIEPFLTETSLRDTSLELYSAGHGDSIDHILARDGMGVSFVTLESKNLWIQTAPGGVIAAEYLAEGARDLSDHAAKYAKLAWTYEGPENGVWGVEGSVTQTPQWSIELLWRQVETFFAKLRLLLLESFRLLREQVV